MGLTKYYLLYNNEEQSKLLTTAPTEEKLKEETEFYTDGVWFEYDSNDGSNHLFNEKKMSGIEFPAEPKKRTQSEFRPEKKIEFKWIE